MGMYTELIFGASFKRDTPKDVIDTLRYLSGETKDTPENLVWGKGRNPLAGASYYFGVNKPVTKMYFDNIRGGWTLSSRANIKNYESEIESFLEWVKPYIESGSGVREMYAIVIYEESEIPDIYYLYD